MPEDSTSPDLPDLPGNLDEFSFEEAMEALEGLVRGMESDQVPIKDLIEGYERGTRLHRICQEKLDEARGRIEMIRRRSDGEAAVEAFEGGGEGTEGESTNQETQTAQQAAAQDGELF